MRQLRVRAEEGDAESLYILANLYDRGFDSIPVDTVRSLELYRLSAEKGYAPAMNYLGYRLISGDLEGKEGALEGIQWLEKAAEAGDAKAASNLGWLYMEGRYTEKNMNKALHWLEKAADANLPTAQSILGDLYREGLGVEADTLRADSLYRTAFEGGLADAGYKLADLNSELYKSLPPEEKVREGKYYYYRYAPSEGVKLFYQAADEGNAEAMALLGDAYTRAVGVPYDHNLSLKYYAKAAIKGNHAAQFIIGELLEIFPDALAGLEETGEELPSDDPFYWYEKAAEGGITDAEKAARSLMEENF